jgi:YidC/Oxa1 family membrane protein insertase
MQDQGKRLLLAVGLALVVMIAWNQLFTTPPPPAKKAVPGAPASPTPALPQVARSPVGVLLDGAVPAKVAQPAEAQTIVLTFPTFEVTFSGRQGAIVSWRLTGKKYANDAARGELVGPGPGLLLVNFARSSHVIPDGAVWKGEQLSATQVRFVHRTDSLEVTKTFTVHPETYVVRLGVSVSVLGTQAAQQRLAVTSYGFQDPKVEVKDDVGSEHPRAFLSSTMVRGELTATTYKRVVAAPRAVTEPQWTGFDHPYMLIAMAPNPKVPAVEKFTSATSTLGLMQTDLLYPMTTMGAGAPAMTHDVVTYVGPKYYEQLEAADKIAGFPTGFKETVDLGWFKVIGRPLLSLLQFLFGLVGNWGIAIVLLTVMVKAATLYWTTKSMRSMKAMAALGPKMKDLQAKYKDDRAKLQQETMALYKHNGVNPLAGCLPIFLQMPIWIALYRMLSSASELYLQPFIPGWIADLTARDPFYILPVVVTGTMFLQTKLQPATGDSTQQKIILYGMPLMFGIMGLFFPAGLTLYMFTNTVLSALHSVYMNKFDKKSLEITAKLQGTATKGTGAGASVSEDKGGSEADEAQASGSSQSKEPAAARNSKKKRRR